MAIFFMLGNDLVDTGLFIFGLRIQSGATVITIMSSSNWLMACVASDKLNMTPTHTPPRNYPPVIRIVGSLWRALYVIHGDVLHDPTTRIARRKISKDGTICCTRCGVITTTQAEEEEDDKKDEDKKDEDKKGEDKKNDVFIENQESRCATCGCENPSTFLNEIDGSTIHIGKKF